MRRVFGNARSGWLFRRFRDDEGGAVSVEFLIVTAATVGLGVAAAGLVGAGVDDLSGKVSVGLSETAPGDEGRGGGNGALEDDEPSGEDADDAEPEAQDGPGAAGEDGNPGDREADRDGDRDDDRAGKNGGKAQGHAKGHAKGKAQGHAKGHAKDHAKGHAKGKAKGLAKAKGRPVAAGIR